FARLAPMGAAALLDALDQLDTLVARAQDPARASHAPMLTKADGAIDFAAPAAEVAARIRGVDPWPGAIAALRGQTIKLYGADATAGEGAPGSVLRVDAAGAIVACGQGAVAIAELQAPGRKRMSAAAFAVGRGIAV